jgi:hypothetical protein
LATRAADGKIKKSGYLNISAAVSTVWKSSPKRFKGWQI